MTKTEFKAQFKRLRVSGYRLPVFDGVTIEDVMAEWFGTFGSCTTEEFSGAVDRLKETKTDTFWPATGEIWTHIRQLRKERRIRIQSQHPGYENKLTDAQAQEFLSDFRQFQKKLVAKMTMPHAEVQTAPDHVQREEEDEERSR